MGKRCPRRAALFPAAKLAGMPPRLRGLVTSCLQKAGKICPGKQDLDMVELFAGKQQLTKAMRCAGFCAEPFDVLYSKKHDIESDEGFRCLLEASLRLKAGGVLWGGPPCKTWIWIARSGTSRSASRPEGDTSVVRVRKGNLQATRFAALAALVVLRSGRFVMENPRSTLLHKLPVVADLLQWSNAVKTTTYMGAFNSEHAKPLDLWSSWHGIVKMHRQKPLHCVPLATTGVDKAGKKQVNGNGKALTDSAAYTFEFGQAFAAALKTPDENEPHKHMVAVQRQVGNGLVASWSTSQAGAWLSVRGGVHMLRAG